MKAQIKTPAGAARAICERNQWSGREHIVETAIIADRKALAAYCDEQSEASIAGDAQTQSHAYDVGRAEALCKLAMMLRGEK